MRKYGESKMTRIMMATVPHVTSGLGLRKFQADGILLTRVYYKRHMITVCCVSHNVVQPQLIILSHFVRVALQTATSDYYRFSMTY